MLLFKRARIRAQGWWCCNTSIGCTLLHGWVWHVQKEPKNVMVVQNVVGHLHSRATCKERKGERELPFLPCPLTRLYQNHHNVDRLPMWTDEIPLQPGRIVYMQHSASWLPLIPIVDIRCSWRRSRVGRMTISVTSTKHADPPSQLPSSWSTSNASFVSSYPKLSELQGSYHLAATHLTYESHEVPVKHYQNLYHYTTTHFHVRIWLVVMEGIWIWRLLGVKERWHDIVLPIESDPQRHISNGCSTFYVHPLDHRHAKLTANVILLYDHEFRCTTFRFTDNDFYRHKEEEEDPKEMVSSSSWNNDDAIHEKADDD